MRVNFDKETHTYSVDGEIVPISVTELLRKHGLAPDYNGASAAALNRAATRGTAVHADIARMINGEAYATVEAKEFKDWATTTHARMRAEIPIGYSKDGFMFAGTIDVFGEMKDPHTLIETEFIGDHKTTAKFEETYVTWQVNLYDYMLRALDGQELNGVKVAWKGGAERFYCFQYSKGGHLSVFPLARIPDSEIEKLLDCERKGTLYKPEILLTAGEKSLLERVEHATEELIEIEQHKRDVEECLEVIQTQLIDMFKERGIKKFENERVRMTYTAPHKQKRLDTKRLQAEQPEVAERYMKECEVKAKVTITIKKEKKDEN